MASGDTNHGATSSNLFCTLMLVLFIGLKLGGVVQWSWLWVLSPLWIPLAFVGLVLMFVGFCLVMAKITGQR